MEVNNTPVIFKIDTGADVTAVPEKLHKTSLGNAALTTPTRALKGPSQERLTVLGVLKAQIQYRDKVTITDIYVIPELQTPLLSRADSEILGVVKRMNEVLACQPTAVDPRTEFPALFHGLGHVRVPYTIKLRPDAVPLSLASPRRIPLPLMDEIKDEIANMVRQEVIEAVEEPTDWCSAMVIVQKPDGKFRICVDYTELNKYVECELAAPPPSHRTRAGTTKWSEIFFENGRQFRVLAIRAGRRITNPDNIHYTFRKIQI